MRAAKNLSTQGDHTRIVRQLADGRMDLSFHAPPGQWRVYSMALQADGKVLVVGAYYGMKFNGKTLGPLARLNSDGSIDSDFNPAIDGYVTSLEVVAGGKILVGGLFHLPNRDGGAVRFVAREERIAHNAICDLDKGEIDHWVVVPWSQQEMRSYATRYFNVVLDKEKVDSYFFQIIKKASK